MIKTTAKTINKIKQYINIYAFKVGKKGVKKNKNSWKDFVIATKKKQENVSGKIDSIIYNN